MGTIITPAYPSARLLASLVPVTKASDLSGILDSTKFYFIDGAVDMGTQSIEIPAGGLFLGGLNVEVSRLFSTEDNHTMFTSPVGGSGSFLSTFVTFTESGATSQLFNIVGKTGNEAIEFQNTIFRDCDSLGTVDNYRQGLETITSRFGRTPTLTLKGAWAGGYRATTTLVRNLAAGMTDPIFKAGAGFIMQSRFLTDVNVDLPALAPLFDFAPANFPNVGTVLLDRCVITRDGAVDANDPNITPNLAAGDLASFWTGNNGIANTLVGGASVITVEAVTTITAQDAFVALAGTWTPSALQHFDAPANGQLRHKGNVPREYVAIIDLVIAGTQNTEITVRLKMWDDSTSSFVTVHDQTRPVLNQPGGTNVAFFGLSHDITLDINDFAFFEVANRSGTQNVTAQLEGALILNGR